MQLLCSSALALCVGCLEAHWGEGLEPPPRDDGGTSVAPEECRPDGPVPIDVTLLEDGDGCWDAPGPEVAWDWRIEWLPLADRPRLLEDEVDGCSQHYEVTSDGIGHAVWLDWTPDGPVGEVITLGAAGCHAHWRIEPAQ
ncbi:MAG: hypothetical protein ACODAG_04315 [Myxococcota bacterium]